MRKKHLDMIAIVFIMVCIISACKMDKTLLPTASVYESNIEPDCTDSLGQDPLGNDYISAATLTGTESLGWSISEFPDDYGFSDYVGEFMLQARDRRLCLQDISARYIPQIGAPYQINLGRKTLEQIYEDLSDITGEYAEINRQFIKTFINKKDNIHYFAVNDTYSTDLNKDGSDEVLSINKSLSQQIVVDPIIGSEIHYSTFSIMINGTTKLSFEYEDLEVYYVYLDTCSILIVQPLGYNAGYSGDYACSYNHKAQIYQCSDSAFDYLGLIDGSVDLVIGEGRFTTLGNADTSPNNEGPVYEVVRVFNKG